MLRLFAPVFAQKILNRSLRLQAKIGYQLKFNDITAEWINGYALADMSNTWQKQDLNIIGLNYFTLGAIKDGLSTRFIPSEKLYQAWLGGYIFSSSQLINWSDQDYPKVCEADQRKWLMYYGLPKSNMNFGKLTRIKDIKNGGINGQLFSWSCSTQSDVGVNSKRLYNRVIMDGMAYIMNRLTPELKLQGNNFIPKEFDKSYADITISGFLVKLDISQSTKALLYVCMAHPNDKDLKTMENLITKHIELSMVE